MPHFYGSEITAVTILELFLLEKNLKVRQNEYAVFVSLSNELFLIH